MHKIRSIAAGAAWAAVLLAGATRARAQGEDQFRFDLPAEALSQALRDVALHTGRNVIAPDSLVQSLRSPPLAGTFTVEEAVGRLLAGSGLRYRLVDGALVIEAGPLASDEHSSRLPGSEGNNIVVTGTHVRGASPTSPLVVLTRKDIERTGATSVDELMRTIPQNSQAGVNKENSLVVLPDQDPTDHGAGINLRGLGQRATLVLLDGRRLAPSSSGSFVDVSMIPISAIERVDILTDGASAIYGSDAVGGVVNFVLRDRFNGLESTVQAGTTTDGGGSELLLSQAAGRSWSGGHGLLAYEFRKENEIRAGQRDFTINLPARTFLLPRERKHSLVGTLGQELAPGLRAAVTATFARRSTERTVFLSISPLPVSVDARARAATVSAGLAYDMGGGWLARLDGNYAFSKTSQIQTQAGGIPVVNSRDIRNIVSGAELHLDGPLFHLPGGTVRLALGGEVRREHFNEAFESSAFPLSTSAAERTVMSAYGELAIPLFSAANRRPGFEALQVSLAARYDHYTRTGSSFDPKIGVLWSPATGLRLRGSYSTSFRAPLLSETTGAYSGIYLPAFFFYSDPTKAPPGSIVLFLQGSNPDVKPETSRNWTLGGDWSPGFAPAASLSINYYSIRYSNRIALPAPFVTVIGDPAFDSIVHFDLDPAEVAAIVAGAGSISDFTGPGFTNGGATPADVDVILDDRITNTSFTATSGIDAGLRYGFSIGASTFAAEASVTHIFKFKQQLTPASPSVQALNRPYQPLRWRARTGLSWTNGGWSGSAFVDYAGRYVDDRGTTVRRVRANATVDAALSYAFGQGSPGWLRGTKLALYARNLFDSRPPRLATDPASSGLGYDPVNASGRGRFVAVQLRKSW